ncbi:hypothetical protein PV516_19630 [Streptomyces scabiei]|uniref:hypothetical protein n=1 Tax=Streptomyces scabiei TaxID=1930 RepID=UPI0029B4503E|nr:hypothetical protein [Streptomyces scabiei]MDX3166002.1 hypothetical protein [Streptomyces scabiei]
MSKKPRRARQVRSRAIEAKKKELGVSHTAALRLVEAEQAAEQQPTWGDLQDNGRLPGGPPWRPDLEAFKTAGEDPEAWGRLLCLECGCRVAQACAQCPGCYCFNDQCDGFRHKQQDLTSVGDFLVAAWVPADLGRREFAQQLADAVRTVVRADTGEQYPCRAEVFQSVFPDQTYPSLPEGTRHASVLVDPYTLRDWDIDGEIEAVAADVAAALEGFIRERYPAQWGPAVLPWAAKDAERIVQEREFAVFTREPDPMLVPGGWEDYVARMTVSPEGDEAATPPLDELPTRVVDDRDQGWHRSSHNDAMYGADFGEKRGLPLLSYAQLIARRGPIRPVVPPTDEDDAAVTGALRLAGRKAAATVLVAAYRVARQYNDDAERSVNRLYAGREGSHESHGLRVLAWEVGCDLAERPGRFHEAAAETIAEVLVRWTSSKDTFTEVAENLLHLFAKVADGDGGWEKVADRYLQPGARVGHPEHIIERVRLFLMGKSSTRF